MMGPSTTRSRWQLGLVAAVVTTLTLGGSVALGRTPTPGPADGTARAAGSMPPLAEGDVAVRFSLAPVRPEDSRLTVLTRWRTCGIWNERWSGPEPSAGAKGVAATARVVLADEEIRIRVDVGAGADGTACDADTLVRLPVVLDTHLGDRRVVDAADADYTPAVNLVDAPDTGLTYSCDYGYPGGTGFTVPELLGPGLAVPPGLDAPPTTLRIVRVDGDEIEALGAVRPNGRVARQTWHWQWQQRAWVGSAQASGCLLRADVSSNQATATWRLRGKRPGPAAKAIRVWVDEQVCNGRPLYGRVAQPIRLDAPDGIIFVASSMRDTVDYEGRYIDDPWERWKDRPGVASRGSGGLAFVDCPGIGPAPYTFNLYRRLGDRKLYDGAFFPPRERPGRSGD